MFFVAHIQRRVDQGWSGQGIGRRHSTSRMDGEALARGGRQAELPVLREYDQLVGSFDKHGTSKRALSPKAFAAPRV